jgi:hypothetical protein
MSSQLRRNDISFDRSIANDSDRTPHVDDGGRLATGGRTSIDDQVQHVA